MKKLGSLFFLLLSFSLFAQDAVDANTELTSSEITQITPTVTSGSECKKILEACQSDGFIKGEHKKSNGLWLDCFKGVLQGNVVRNVNPADFDTQACKRDVAKKVRKHKKH